MRKCLNCNSTETYLKYGKYENWMKYKDGVLCAKCYSLLVSNPKRPQGYNDKYNVYNNPRNNPRRILFKDKIISLEENPRRGKCTKCKKQIGDKYINHKGEVAIIQRTHMHHKNYHDGDPLKDTEELCVSCHTKLSKEIRDKNELR